MNCVIWSEAGQAAGSSARTLNDQKQTMVENFALSHMATVSLKRRMMGTP
jgi:hypothetical protein